MRLLLALVLALVPGTLLSQDEVHHLVLPPTMTFTIEAGTAFGGTILLAESMQPTDQLTLLQIPNVLDELELVDDQKAKLASKLATLIKNQQEKESQLTKEMNGSPEWLKKIEESRRKYSEAVKSASEDILLPFQLDRLTQIRRQAELRAGGSRAIESDDFAKLLNLTPEQKSKLQEKAAETEKKLVLEVRELREKRQRELLEDVLTKKQLKILNESLGKPMSDVSK